MAMGFCILLCFLECSGVSQDDFSMILESSRQTDAHNLGPTLPKDFADLLKPAWTMESMMGFLVEIKRYGISATPQWLRPDQLESVPVWSRGSFSSCEGLKIQGSRSGCTQDESCFPAKSLIIIFWRLCRVPSPEWRSQRLMPNEKDRMFRGT